MKYTCALCYPRVKKYFSSIQEGHDHAREHFDQMRVDNDELTVEGVHQMCFPKPRLWVEPRPIETLDIESDEDVRESVEEESCSLETNFSNEGIASAENRPMETDESQNGVMEPTTPEHDSESAGESSKLKMKPTPETDRIAKADLIQQRTQAYARIKKYVRNDRLECRLCRKKIAIIHRGEFFGQNAMRHIEAHLQIRYYKCGVCSKAYYNRRGLNSHVASCHTGVTDGVIDESMRYSEQILDMLAQCFDHGQSESSSESL